MLAAIGATSLLLRGLAENDQLWREVWHLMRLPVRQLPESQVGWENGGAVGWSVSSKWCGSYDILVLKWMKMLEIQPTWRTCAES